MQLRLNKKLLKENAFQLLRGAGYVFVKGDVDGEASFERILGAGGYPKFHLYLKNEGEELVLNLHLDQKRPSYAGSHAHSGEYDGGLLEEEIERIKSLAN